MTTPEENQFDDLLRNAFAGFRSPPDAHVWPGVQAAVRRQPPTLWQRLRPVGGGMLLGALLTGVVLHETRPPAPTSAAVATPIEASPTTIVTPPVSGPPVAAPWPATVPAPSAMAPQRPVAAPVARAVAARPRPTPAVRLEPSVGVAASTGNLPAGGVTGAGFGLPVIAVAGADSARTKAEDAAAQPAAGRPWQAGLALDVALNKVLTRSALPERLFDEQTQGTPTSLTADTAATRQVRALVLAEAAVLRALTHRNDSLLQLLAEAPGPPAADSVPARKALAPPRSWALLLTADLTGGWGTMPGLNANATETLHTSQTQAVSVVRQLNERWRVRLGAGQTVLRTQLQNQWDTTGLNVRFDTTHTTTMQLLTSVDTTVVVQMTTVMHLEPQLNNMGQVIGYDTSYVPIRDTTFQVVTSHDTLRTHQTKVTRREEQWQERRQQSLRPEYRFWTIPVAAQYALLVRGRLRLGVSAGAQLLIFRGGMRPVLHGREYILQRVGPRDGPFRPVSLAWQTSADVEWRVGPHLSAAVSPGLRGWAIRPERSLRAARPIPTVQLGLMWHF